MEYAKYHKRRELRVRLAQDGFRIANALEYAILKFILGKENHAYPTQHTNDILNHLEENERMLIPGYESHDIVMAILKSLHGRGALGYCCDVHFDNLPNAITAGYRIPDDSVRNLVYLQERC